MLVEYLPRGHIKSEICKRVHEFQLFSAVFRLLGPISCQSQAYVHPHYFIAFVTNIKL